jgi:UDP-galactopyranose mutase
MWQTLPSIGVSMLLAFSHLRWGFVWQRPQHLLSRFAREMPVVVVEEPELGFARDDVRLWHDRGLTVVTPLLAGSRVGYGFGADVNRRIGHLIAPFVPPEKDPIFWYYTPMALGAEPPGVRPSLSVYDAMDDLASFHAAPLGMREQEARLLARADLVFTGGPTLYEQRRQRHPAVYCFPSGVESSHFAAARNGIARPLDLARRSRPILGYYGVIDERLDLPLLAELADLRPSWTIALVGPVAKIDAATIPVRDNIALFGQQAYSDLPGFLASFDIALMPFARNEATRAISPTKTLEYLAGGKPVISTPIADVAALYAGVVHIAVTAGEVVAAAEELLARTAAEDHDWQDRVTRLLAVNEWDAVARQMLQLMARARVAAPLPAAEAAVALSA